MKVLVVEDEEDIKECIVFLINTEFTCSILTASNGEEAVNILASNSDIQLIITDYNMPVANADKIFEYLQSQNLKLDVILISGRSLEDLGVLELFKQNHYHFMQKPFEFEDLISKAEKLIQDKGAKTLINEPEYIRFNSSILLYSNEVPVNVYIKLSDSKFVKFIEQDFPYDLNLVLEHIKLKTDHFYIKLKDYTSIISYFNRHVQGILSDENLPTKQVVNIQKQLINTHKDFIAQLNISSELIETINILVETILASLKSEPSIFKKYLDQFNQEDYIMGHGLLISYISCAMALKLGWNAKSTYKIFITSAFLHDSILQDESLAELHDSEKGVELIKDHTLKELILSHPRNTADTIGKYNNVPKGVVSIVLNHHEKINGGGYPRGVDFQSLHPFCLMFILAEEFSSFTYSNGFKIDKNPEFLLQLKKKYPQAALKNYVEAIEFILS